MKYTKFLKRLLCSIMSVITFVTALNGSVIKASAVTSMAMSDFSEIVSTYNIDSSIPSYKTYLEMHQGASYPDIEVVIPAGGFTRYEENGSAVTPDVFADFEGASGASVLTSEDSLIEFGVDIPESGFYNLTVTYYSVAGKNSDIERSFFINGALPFKELNQANFTRVWKNVAVDTALNDQGVNKKIWAYDNQGNHIKPNVIEIPEWQDRFVYDSNGYITKPLHIYFDAGYNTISMLSRKEPMLINKLTLSNQGILRGYDEVKAQWDLEGAKQTGGHHILIEAEYATKTSSQMLYPQQDQISPAISPVSARELLNNSIGGISWSHAGQWVEWEFSVPESGYYHISMFNCQNFVRGVHVSRRVYINGEIPFAEMSEYAFHYKQNYREDVFSDSDGNPYLFYLEAGSHTIRMEAVLGEFSEIVRLVDESVMRLNAIYRQVIRVIGTKPDTFRDYQIPHVLPHLNAELVEARDVLNEALARLEEVAGHNTDKKAVLLTMRDMVNDLIRDEERFVRIVKNYRENVRACGNWIGTVITQSLQVDRINIYSPDVEIKFAKTSVFAKIWFEIKRLFYSFVIDYNRIGSIVEGGEKKAITIWIGSGRDQANIIKNMIDETFTSQTGIGVNVQLVDMTTLLRASLVGEGPDVAIQVANTNAVAGAVLETGNDTPVNYGIRNAVLDLARFDDIDTVLERFPFAAYEQFSFGGAVYALPETLTYPVMFYRKDILSEIGLEVPVTWDDVKVAMSVLAKNQMEFGMLPKEQVFASLLYQNGGSYYTEDARASALSSDIAVSVFREFCEFYTDYKLDKDASVEERFRMGESPIMISDYTTYNNFAVSAPDIAGLWSFAPFPGTRKPDGSIDFSVASTGLAAMIMADTKAPDESWEFLKWWTSKDTQVKYGREMESLMGAAARVPTANYEAFLSMPWPIDDFKSLVQAKEWVRGIPQVPGGYYSWRNTFNAYFIVYDKPDTKLPREELMEKVIYINAEIDYKREELGLN